MRVIIKRRKVENTNRRVRRITPSGKGKYELLFYRENFKSKILDTTTLEGTVFEARSVNRVNPCLEIRRLSKIHRITCRRIISVLKTQYSTRTNNRIG